MKWKRHNNKQKAKTKAKQRIIKKLQNEVTGVGSKPI